LHRAKSKTSIRTAVALAALTALCGAQNCIGQAAPAAQPAHATQNVVFDHYVQLTEARMAADVAPGGAFLRVDALSPANRDAARAALRNGELKIESLITLDRGEKIACPNCLIHHWVGIVFIPGATLEQTLKLMQDYDHQAAVYTPEMVQSKIISHTGDDFHVFMRFHRTKIITVVLDTEHDVHYQRLDAMREISRSVSTRVQEVANAGSAKEHDRPPGQDNGYLWRINSYWKFLERDGGIYVQCESVSLTRDIPTGLGWLIGPYLESVPRESLSFTLEATRKGLSHQLGQTDHR